MTKDEMLKQLSERIFLALEELEEFREKYSLWNHKELDEIENTLRGNDDE